MADKDFFAEYETDVSYQVPAKKSNFVEADREFPIEPRCCITGDEVKHSYCRYPDPEVGSMMVMSRPTMLRYCRDGNSLSQEFERVLSLRRKKEGKH